MSTPKVALVMIVRDEAEIIAETLEHLRSSVDYAVICDTGSTDQTARVVRETCARLNLPLTWREHMWRDFAHNRTLAFEVARKVPADFYLVFDADDLLLDPIDRKQLNRSVDAYTCVHGTERNRYARLTLFRATLQWAYRGVLHEFPYCVTQPTPNTQALPNRIQFNGRGVSARNRAPEKYRNDAAVLVRALQTETDPGLVSRYLYYAARSFMDAEEYAQAIIYFLQYLDDPRRWFEERFDACMCIGRCRWSLFLQGEGVDLVTIRDAFLQAVVEDPERAEPWYELARLYRNQQQYAAAYAYAKTGARIATPPQRSLFLDPTVYTYRILDELAIAAYWTGRRSECRDLCQTLLRRTDLTVDDRTRIQENLQYCN